MVGCLYILLIYLCASEGGFLSCFNPEQGFYSFSLRVFHSCCLAHKRLSEQHNIHSTIEVLYPNGLSWANMTIYVKCVLIVCESSVSALLILAKQKPWFSCFNSITALVSALLVNSLSILLAHTHDLLVFRLGSGFDSQTRLHVEHGTLFCTVPARSARVVCMGRMVIALGPHL